MSVDNPLLIVGAGPTGLSLALFLHNLGLPFRIIEKNKNVNDLSKALYIQPRTLEIFEMLGIVDKFITAGRKVRGVQFWTDGRCATKMSYEGLPTSYPYLLIVPQNKIEEILQAELKKCKIKVERGKELISLYAGGETPAAVIQEEDDVEELHPPFIIGCDGAHSTVRHQCGFSFEGKQYRETFSLGDVHVQSPYLEDEMYIFFTGANGPVATFPFPEKGKIRLVVSHPAGSVKDQAFLKTGSGESQALFMHSSLSENQLQEYIDQRGLSDIKIQSSDWLSDFHIHKRITSKWRKGRVFVAGDAAHIHSPLGGQGLNTGIQDAWNLAWKLLFVHKLAAKSILLETYQKERHAIGKQVLAISNGITQLAVVKYAWLAKIRNWLLSNIVSRPFMTHMITRKLSQLYFNYPSSPLTQKDYFQNSGPIAGLRAPDAPLEGTTLFKMLSTKCFTCLIFTGLNKSATSVHEALALKQGLIDRFGEKLIKCVIITPDGHVDRAAVKDNEGACHKVYGVHGPHTTLVRPDGYISLQHDKIEQHPIEDLLKGLF